MIFTSVHPINGFADRPKDKIRVAVIRDYPEENWPSMDLCAAKLHESLIDQHSNEICARLLCPPFRHRLSRTPFFGGQNRVRNADRFVNRFWDYPRWLAKQRSRFDLFHIVDHSYAQLVHTLPAERTVVTCNDLDSFRCLLEPESERRSIAFRAMAQRILRGLQKAARVVCISRTTRDALLAHGLVPSERLEVVHLGVDPVFSPHPDPRSDAEAVRLLGASDNDRLEILNVGSTIRRKRIDVLLHVFGTIKRRYPCARLVRAGGQFTASQCALIRQLGLEDSIVVLPFLNRAVLASVYRRAAVVLQPSDSEGFGLPLIEALACGIPVVASDLLVFREVAQDAVSYCDVGDIPAWCETVVGLLGERFLQPNRREQRRAAGLIRAAKFSWKEHARRMVQVYYDVFGAPSPPKSNRRNSSVDGSGR